MNAATTKPQLLFHQQPLAPHGGYQALRPLHLVAGTQHFKKSPKQNHLLAALPPDDYARLLPHLIPMEMPAGYVIHQSGCRLGSVYFPVDSTVSLQRDMEDGTEVEISMVGYEGMIGIALFMGGDTIPDRAVVRSPGTAFRLEASLLKAECRHGGALNRLLLRYTQALITQVAQSAICNRRHAVEQQLCRRLLLSLDHQPSNELSMTQELISSMLGVRREAVTVAAGKLQLSGMIAYSRGHITVLDRSLLEKTCCECYAVVKKEFDRLLPDAVAV